MNTILTASCHDLLRKISLMKESIKGKNFPSEINPCIDWINSTTYNLEIKIKKIQYYTSLAIDDKELNHALLTELVNANHEIEVIDSNILHALVRFDQKDILALKMINWLYEMHPQVRNKAFIFSNGVFSVAPSNQYPTLYWLPLTSQLSLLHLPLLFHEFGHQLFSFHEKEMIDLIDDFQKKLKIFLRPAISQSDNKYKAYIDKALDIVETWREWMEELFCDAVGLTIGGNSYLKAFSYYTRLGGSAEFFIPENFLSKSNHPITFLRIRFLIDRANLMGLETEAIDLEEEWMKIGNTLKVKEDYFGFYKEEYRQEIIETINNMLIEVDPISFLNNKDRLEKSGIKLNLIEILLEVWYRYIQNPSEYYDWENETIKKIL